MKLKIQFYSVFSPCEICGDFFQDDAMKYGDKFYHWGCLCVCNECGQEFIEGQSIIFRPSGWEQTGENCGLYREGRWVHQNDDECPCNQVTYYVSLTVISVSEFTLLASTQEEAREKVLQDLKDGKIKLTVADEHITIQPNPF